MAPQVQMMNHPLTPSQIRIDFPSDITGNREEAPNTFWLFAQKIRQTWLQITDEFLRGRPLENSRVATDLPVNSTARRGSAGLLVATITCN